MIIENNVLRITGNKFKEKIGKKFVSIGNKLVVKGNGIIARSKDIIVTNPTVSLTNAFTLIIVFTVENTQKYQIVLQGDYKALYKESEDKVPNLTENELFQIIYQNQKNWFKRE